MRKLASVAAIAAPALAVLAIGCASGGSPIADEIALRPASQAASAAEAPNRGLPRGSEPVVLDPADFTLDIDNPYWPMRAGSRWVYRETDTEGTEEKVVVTVTKKTKRIANGIRARVIRDVVTEDGVPVEITDDWYAQDRAGNIW